MMKKSKTFIATPPGATIKEQLAMRGMSQKEFAQRMAMSEKHISHLINGDVQLTQETARRKCTGNRYKHRKKNALPRNGSKWLGPNDTEYKRKSYLLT